jgi:hypothetical protein
MPDTAHSIVVDTSVAGAAGSIDSSSPTSVNCCDSLTAMREYGHRLVMSEPIQAKWMRHASYFALKWWTNMEHRRQVLTLNNPIHADLRAALAVVLSAEASQKIADDIPLLEAALASDRRILSLNEKDRNHFRHAAQSANPGIVALRDILWVNPDSTLREDAPAWLRAGAPDEPQRRLGWQGIDPAHA